MNDETYVHPTAVVDPVARLGKGVRIWHFCHVMAEAELGDGVSLGQNAFVARGVRIGAGTRIQNNVSLYEGVELGCHVFVGPSVVFTNVRNPRAATPRRGQYERTVVDDHATIGANATIRCGVRLFEGAFVGAGAVVTKDVPAYAMVLGVPARTVGFACRCGEALGAEAAPGRFACAHCEAAYERAGAGLKHL